MSYDLEMYAKALEDLAQWGPTPIKADDDPIDYAKHEIYLRGFRKGLKQAADMLRKSPMGLYVMYPDYFPEPPKDTPDA